MASLFYDAMQKIAVLKAEHGGRSYAADLTQPLPDREKDRDRKASMNADVDEEQGVGVAAASTKVFPGQEGLKDGETGLWPGWDDSIWGWDLGTQFDFDASAWQAE